MGNSSKKITTDSTLIYITEEKIKIGFMEEKESQVMWSKHVIKWIHNINTKNISEYYINITSENLIFDIYFINLEICKWIHDILSIRRLSVEFTILANASNIVRHLVDNSSIYNTSYLIFGISYKLSQEIFKICDSIFIYAAKLFHVKKIIFSVFRNRDTVCKRTYDENTVELDD